MTIPWYIKYIVIIHNLAMETELKIIGQYIELCVDLFLKESYGRFSLRVVNEHIVNNKHWVTYSSFKKEPYSVLMKKKSFYYKLEEFIDHGDHIVKSKNSLQDCSE